MFVLNIALTRFSRAVHISLESCQGNNAHCGFCLGGLVCFLGISLESQTFNKCWFIATTIHRHVQNHTGKYLVMSIYRAQEHKITAQHNKCLHTHLIECICFPRNSYADMHSVIIIFKSMVQNILIRIGMAVVLQVHTSRFKTQHEKWVQILQTETSFNSCYYVVYFDNTSLHFSMF